ncbi:linoleate 13S-lipoxygenase 2-1, chloroplastic-like protein [Tanacetum coccineum]
MTFHDEEFCRQMLVGLNPYSIQLVTEWSLKSKLDPEVYAPSESAITKEIVEEEILESIGIDLAIYVHHMQDYEFNVGHLKRFVYRELQVSIGNFSSKNILGQSGFGMADYGRGTPLLDWSRRMHIALGAARGLLHHNALI